MWPNTTKKDLPSIYDVSTYIHNEFTKWIGGGDVDEIWCITRNGSQPWLPKHVTKPHVRIQSLTWQAASAQCQCLWWSECQMCQPLTRVIMSLRFVCLLVCPVLQTQEQVSWCYKCFVGSSFSIYWHSWPPGPPCLILFSLVFHLLVLRPITQWPCHHQEFNQENWHLLPEISKQLWAATNGWTGVWLLGVESTISQLEGWGTHLSAGRGGFWMEQWRCVPVIGFELLGDCNSLEGHT